MKWFPESLQPRNLLERLKAVGRLVLWLAFRASLEETVAGFAEASLAARRRTTEAAITEVKWAKSLDVGQDETLAKIMAAHNEDTVEIAAIARQVLSAGTMNFDEGKAALERAPFDSAVSAETGAPALNGRPQPQQALPNGSTQTRPQLATPNGLSSAASDRAEPPVKRGRGRPRKDEVRPPQPPA